MRGIAYRKTLENLIEYSTAIALVPFAPFAVFGGCATSPALPLEEPELEQEPKTEIDETAIKLRDIYCGPLSKYGDDYERSCRHYARQCTEQYKQGNDTFIFHQDLGPSLSMSTFEECMATSAALVQQMGPVSPRVLPLWARPSPSLYTAEEMTHVRSLSDQHSAPDRRMLTTASRIFADHGLLKDGEDVDTVIEGRVVAAHKSESGRKELVLIMVDVHDTPEVQEQIMDNVESLHARGLALVTGEGEVKDRHITRHETISKEYCIENSKQAFRKIACESDIYVVGAEHPELYVMGAVNAEKMMELRRQGRPVDNCAALNVLHDFLRLNHMRSHTIARYTLHIMEVKEQQKAALIIGMGHLNDLEAIFDQEDVNYVAIAVPAVDKESEERFSSPGKAKEVEDGGLWDDPAFWDECHPD